MSPEKRKERAWRRWNAAGRELERLHLVGGRESMIERAGGAPRVAGIRGGVP